MSLLHFLLCPKVLRSQFPNVLKIFCNIYLSIKRAQVKRRAQKLITTHTSIVNTRMPVVIHKEFIQSTLKERDWDFDIEDEPKKKKRRLTTYNKFLRNTMKVVRGKYPGEKKGYYMQLVGAMWRSMSLDAKAAFAKTTRCKKTVREA